MFEDLDDFDEYDPFVDTSNGTFRFTEGGLATLTKPFGKAGINIHTITTYEAYLAARERISIRFPERLLDYLKSRPAHLENDILQAIARQDYVEMERLHERLKRRYRLGLHAV